MRFKPLAFFSCLTRKKTQATPMIVTNFCEKSYRCVTMSINFYLILYNRNKILFLRFIIELFVFISTHLDEGKVSFVYFLVSIVCVLPIVHC